MLLFSNRFKNYWNLGSSVVNRDDIIAAVDKRLLQIKPPKSITRTPETFKRIGSQKASQWRSFIVFYCVVCLKGLLKEEYLNHLALLSTAMHILLQKSITVSEVQEAHDLLNCYQLRYQEYFGAENMVYNVHLLSHLCKGVLRFGPIWGHNAFPFEGQNRYILQMCTSPFNVVKQVSKRYMLNRSFPGLCVKLSSGDQAIDFCEDTLERQLKCFVYTVDCLLVGKGMAALLNNEENICLKNCVNFIDVKTTLSFKSMIVRGFRVSVRTDTGEFKKQTRNINSYVKVKEIGYACIEKILYYKIEESVFVLVRPVVTKNEPLVTQIVGEGMFSGNLEHVKTVEPQMSDLKCVNANDIVGQCVFMNLLIGSTEKEYICELPYGCYRD